MGYKYHLKFPDRWIENECPNTGRECPNCVGEKHDGFAMWRGIVLGYCANCAIYVYNYNRGGGFLSYGFQNETNDYLGTIDLETFGDLADNPENTMENLAARKQEYEEEEQNRLDKEAELERKIDEYEEELRRMWAEEHDDDDEPEHDYQLDEEIEREKEWNDYMDELYEKHERKVLGKNK